jgi:2-oxoisovalerate dehydrogenase E2 component (dihydrolipoyl transacylase)
VLLTGGSGGQPVQETPKEPEPQEQELELGRNDTKAAGGDVPASIGLPSEPAQESSTPQRQPGKHASLATPAVRHMIKQHALQIEDIEGTGKEGRVLKDDVQRHISCTTSTPSPSSIPHQASVDETRPLTPMQSAMYKTMTRSLSIPHFLYTTTVSFDTLSSLRRAYNASLAPSESRITPLPIITKAVSLILLQYPLLNAHLDTTTNPEKPQLIYKKTHDIGIAVDSPQGLLVPVIRNVQSHTILSLGAEISRLASLARSGKLTSSDLAGATFTVSNIGSIGGGTVAPVIVGPQVGILGIGKAKVVPAFGETGELVKREECVFSWSADHRVVDGAYVARAAEEVRRCVEGVEGMLFRMR